MHIQVLKRACKNRNYDTVKCFLENAAKMAKTGSISVENGDGTACRCSTCEVRDKTVIEPINATSQRHFRLAVTEQCRQAVEENHTVLIKLLVDSGYVNVCDISLHYAVRCGCEYFVALLVKAGVDVDEGHDQQQAVTPLYLASTHCHRGIVTQLLNAGACVHTGDSSGRSVLYHAIRHESGDGDEIALQLFRAGANPNHLDRYKQTPFLYAAKLCRSRLIAAFVASGLVDVNTSGERWAWSPLHLCIMEAHCESLETAKILLDAGANVDQCNIHGYTPLTRHVATLNAEPNIVQLLLEHGANVNARTNCTTAPFYMVMVNDMSRAMTEYSLRDDLKECDYGHTALEQAICSRNFDIVHLLVDAGADVEPTWRWEQPGIAWGNNPVASLQIQAILVDGKHRQEWRRLVALALILRPFNLPVLAVYEIYCSLPCHAAEIVSRYRAWQLVVSIKSRQR